MTLFFHILMFLIVKFNDGLSKFEKDHPLGSVIIGWLFLLIFLSDVSFALVYFFTGWYLSETLHTFIILSIITYPMITVIAAFKQFVYDPWNEKLKDKL